MKVQAVLIVENSDNKQLVEELLMLSLKQYNDSVATISTELGALSNLTTGLIQSLSNPSIGSVKKELEEYSKKMYALIESIQADVVTCKSVIDLHATSVASSNNVSSNYLDKVSASQVKELKIIIRDSIESKFSAFLETDNVKKMTALSDMIKQSIMYARLIGIIVPILFVINILLKMFPSLIIFK